MTEEPEKVEDELLEKKIEDKSSEKKEPELISIKKSTYNKLIVGIIMAVGVAAFFGGFGVGLDAGVPSEIVITDSRGPSQTPATQPQQQQQSQKISVSIDDDPVKGDPNAPITMIEFSDFQCPFCGRFFSSTLPLIEKNYIETGKVKFVYRDFPIQSIHPNALPAAISAECADDQGVFWEYHDKLFETLSQWENLDQQNAVRTFEQFAEDLGLDTNTFNNCLESGKYLEEVQKDLNDGVSYGVTGTPGFFIGNERIGYTMVSGAQPYAAFEQLLNELLAS